MLRNVLQFNSVDSAIDPRSFSRSSSTWSCFGRCFRNGKDLEQDQECFVTTTERKRSCDVETERRIKEWILETRLCYDPAPERLGHNADASQKVGEISDGLECYSLAACRPTEKLVALSTVNNNDRRRNRWKGRIPSESLLISPPTTAADTTSQAVPVKPQALPAEPHWLVPTHSSAAGNTGAGRVIWMRRSATLQGRRSSSRNVAQSSRPAGPANS